MQILHRSFAPADLVGGHPVLDFINTAPGRDASPRDWLDGYDRLLEWAALSGAFAPEVLEELRAVAEKSPAAAEAALGRARALRERLFKIFHALALGDEPPAKALDELQACWAEAAAQSRFAREAGRMALQPSAAGLDRIGAQMALEAVELLCRGPLHQLKLCGGHDCAWLFLDTSKNHRRRWCSMATCGNSAKARRHYHRRKDVTAA